MVSEDDWQVWCMIRWYYLKLIWERLMKILRSSWSRATNPLKHIYLSRRWPFPPFLEIMIERSDQPECSSARRAASIPVPSFVLCLKYYFCNSLAPMTPPTPIITMKPYKVFSGGKRSQLYTWYIHSIKCYLAMMFNQPTFLLVTQIEIIQYCGLVLSSSSDV